MPDTKPTGVLITISQIHEMVSKLNNDTMDIKSRLRAIERIDKRQDEHDKRINGLEKITSAHSIIIGIVVAAITTGIGAILGVVF